jgi:tryptophan synthase beta chain
LSEEIGRKPVILVNLSGRGDKDVHTAGAYFGILDETETLVPGEQE